MTVEFIMSQPVDPFKTSHQFSVWLNHTLIDTVFDETLDTRKVREELVYVYGFPEAIRVYYEGVSPQIIRSTFY